MVWAMSMSMALLTAGCGGQSGAGTEHARSSTGDAIQTMGRYIETEADLSVQLEDTAGIYKMQDGKLVIVGRQGAFLVSEDGGETWKSGEGDPDMTAVPQEKLKVYSLEKSSDMYTAVSFYQIQHPDVFVEYEVGMEEGDAFTKEDAVKKLNTRIMTGEGPDILMLDGLPLDSYTEKGMLWNLNELIEEPVRKQIFDNLIRAFDRGDGIFAVPGQIMFPVLLGKEANVIGMKNFSAMADGIEQMRSEAPGRDLTGLCCEKAVMKIGAVVTAGQWKKENGEIDRNSIAEFLARSKRIYDAQTEELTAKTAERLRQTKEYYIQNVGEDWTYDLINYGFYMDYVAGYSKLFAGVSSSPRSYMELVSVSKAEGFEDTALISMEGKQGSVFLPKTILGISKATQKKELAADFLNMFLEKENQCSLSGYPVNRAAFDEAFLPEEESGENGEYGRTGVIDEEGREIWLKIYLPTQEETDVLLGWMESAAVPYTEDAVLEECVIEEGASYLLEERGMEETLDAIERRIGIYLTE